MSSSNRLVADVGGTNTRLALYDEAAAELRAVVVYTNSEHPSLQHIIEQWLEALEGPRPTQCCIAAAAPPSGDRVKMINIDWSFSCNELTEQFGFSRCGWLNDFKANAHSLPHLGSEDYEVLRSGRVSAGATLATVGPGTGLGGATLRWVNGQPQASDSEPGHAGLSPATDLELELFSLLVPRYGEINAELLVSGAGLSRLQQALSEIRGEAIQELSPAAIAAMAQQQEDDCCVQTLHTFCALLGSACGDFVLSNGAYGGLYLAGGIVPRILHFLRASSFAHRFSQKGEMSKHLEEVPLYAITAAQPGLIGASHAPLSMDC